MTHQEADAADAVAAIDPCLQVRFDDGFIECDVGALRRPDLGTIEALARLALTARRLDRRICLRGTSPDLLGLLTLTGLDDVLRTAALSALEAGRQVEAARQTEQGKEPGGVQEERNAGDLAT